MRCDVAKNVILAGVKAVVLHDTADCQLQDLSAQFYLTEKDVGSNRAVACQEKLQELNTAVSVSASSSELSEGFLTQFQVISWSSAHVSSLVKQQQTQASCLISACKTCRWLSAATQCRNKL